MTRRATDLLDHLPDWPAFVAARAARDKTELLREAAGHDARHIVRSGLRDVIDQLEATERQETS